MGQELLDLKVEITELRQTIATLLERVEQLEQRESGSGMYMDGVSEGYREYIEKKLGGR